GNLHRPFVLHMAMRDRWVQAEVNDLLERRLSPNPLVTIHKYPGADHAFARHGGKTYSKPEADRALALTVDFFQQHLGSRVDAYAWMNGPGIAFQNPFVPAERGTQQAQPSLAKTWRLSSPRRRGPITPKVSVIAGPCHIALLRRMGPRLRGDDSGEPLLH